MSLMINEALTKQLKEKIAEVNVRCREREQAAEEYVSYQNDGGADQEILDDLQRKKATAEDAFFRERELLADFVMDHQKQVLIVDDVTGEADEENCSLDRIDDYTSSELI